jgi:hypothetical protein
VPFVLSLPALRSQVIQANAALVSAHEDGQLSAFGEENTRQLVNLLAGRGGKKLIFWIYIG